jgi:CheY-like chemotaxis protein
MTQPVVSLSYRILLVDDDEAVREMMKATLTGEGFIVVAAAGVREALKFIAIESFDVLITDFYMPNPSDGFAVVTAMRHSQPNALTLLVSGYPDVKSARNNILLQADAIIVKPFEVAKLAELVREKLLNRDVAVRVSKVRVAEMLHRSTGQIVEAWLLRVKKNKELNRVALSNNDRTGHLPKLIADLVVRLSAVLVPNDEGESICSTAAEDHGKMRYLQGYTPGMLVPDSRILQVTLFARLQNNLNALDFSLLLPDIMTIADEVDSQLTQAMDSYMSMVRTPAAA